MNTEVKALENSIVSLTVEVGADVVAAAVTKAYNEMKKDFNMPGFRKGKVPKAMIEKMREELASTQIKEFLNKMSQMGFDYEKTITLLEKLGKENQK